jgi:GNAT superfamily N-acetyltransferase
MPDGVTVRSLPTLGESEVGELCSVLVDCVEGGASVSFLLPMTDDKARAFWLNAADEVARGARKVLVAEDESGTIVGTTTVLLNQPENQPHRGDIAKMLVRRQARGRGIGALLLEAAEQEARRNGKSLLVLDTVTGTAAERLYVRRGWQRCGEIPDYALWPDGRRCPTTVYYKAI